MQKTTSKITKKLSVLLLVLLIVIMLLPVVVGFAPLASANGFNRLEFDNTHINDDLLYFEQQGTFNADDFNGNIVPSLVMFLEYAFHPTNQSSYALYLYIHNPEGRQFHHATGNSVTMAYRYNDLANPAGYRKFPLHYLNSSHGQFGNRVFSKFRVLQADMHLERFSTTGTRRYDISEFELHFVGNNNPTAHGIGTTYKFTGYLDTLRGTTMPLDTVELEVEQTHYRTGATGNSGGWRGHQYQVSTVYFGVPGEIMRQHGDVLASITAQWYEFVTTPILVTNRQSLHDAITGQIGRQVEFNNDVGYFVAWGWHRDFVDIILSPLWASHQPFDFGWNHRPRSQNNGMLPPGGIQLPNLLPSTLNVRNRVNMINYSFLVNGRLGDATITGEQLSQFMHDYSRIFPHSNSGYVQVGARQFSNDLFEPTMITQGRTRGFNKQTIHRGNLQSLTTWADANTSLATWARWGWWPPRTGGYYANITPIFEVAAEHMRETDDTVLATTLLISEHDVPAFRAYFAARTARSERVFLFRHAFTDYHSNPAVNRVTLGGLNPRSYSFVAQQTVFKDLDIIELTFDNNGVYTVIPVVMSPIDVIGNVTPPLSWLPSGGWPWWAWLVLGLIVIVLFFVILAVYRKVRKKGES
jgi:hypothetical protein